MCRDACDDARLLDGKALLRFVSDSRLAQIDEKKTRKEQLKKVRCNGTLYDSLVEGATASQHAAVLGFGSGCVVVVVC